MKKMFLLLFLFLLILPVKAQPKISGIAFGDFYYNVKMRDTSKKDMNGFQFRRIYFTTDFAISESFDSRFRLEADQSTNSLTSGGKLGVMVKDAWLKWKNIFSGSDLFFGISPTPAFEISDASWGYRSLEKTILDFDAIVSSRDFGADLRGNFDNGGSMKYWVKIANNNANGPEADKYKRYYGLLHFLPFKGFQFTVYGDFASFADKMDVNDAKKTKNNGAVVGAIFANFYETNKYSFGLESFYKSQQNNYLPAATTAVPKPFLQSQVGYGVSLWGWYAVTDLIRLVVRFDTYEPNKDKGNDKQTLVLGGIDFHVDKNVSIIPNFESLTQQGIATGGASASDLVARVTFAYSF